MLASSLTMIKWADNFMSESSETASPNPTPTEFTGRRGASCRENSLGYLRLLCPWNSRGSFRFQAVLRAKMGLKSTTIHDYTGPMTKSAHPDVAQVSNLLYRRFPIGKPSKPR